MDGRLGVLGVGPQGEELYRHVLRAPGLTLAAHVAQLGWTDYEAEHAIEQLRARRLVRVTNLGEVVADHPRRRSSGWSAPRRPGWRRAGRTWRGCGTRSTPS